MRDTFIKAMFPIALVLSFTADRVTKYAAEKAGFRISFNGGISFGLFGGGTTITLTVLNIAVAVFVAVYCVFVLRRAGIPARTGCGLMLGGVLGNLVDRILLGGVIDWFPMPFFDLIFKGGLWCNAADIFLTLGACLILIEFLMKHIQNPV